MHKSSFLDYIMTTNLSSGWSAMFGTVTESAGKIFEVPSYIYFQNICHRTFYTAKKMISMQDL